MARELERFRAEHPRSLELAEQARRNLLGGVPMHWMVRWPGGFPVFAAEAEGARFRDVDGHEYVDLCLGDTGAMTGHAPAPTVAAINRQAPRGITLMLPSEDALWVGEELQRRFGLPTWQFALTATDANRFAIRIARAITRRPKILVFNWCYHGTVDETFATLDEDHHVVAREGNIGPPVPLAETTRVVEFNDVERLEHELATGDVACVLAEPALTNIGIVLPAPGFHDGAAQAHARHRHAADHRRDAHDLRRSRRLHAGVWPRAGHADDRQDDRRRRSGRRLRLLGAVAERVQSEITDEVVDTGGIGGTLAANVLSLAAMRATLAEVLTDEAFERMIALGERFETGVQEAIDTYGLPWHVTRLGCRVEYLFHAERAVTGSRPPPRATSSSTSSSTSTRSTAGSCSRRSTTWR